ncbi:MAG: helix-turn-helix transcriptional regulator [Limisphaerales bacterium]
MARFDIHNKWLWQELARQARFNAQALSQNLQISSRQLRRYTEQVFGTSAQRWLNERRLEAAAELLRTTRSAKYVALELGFKQLAHFSREFKTHHGMAPRDFLRWSDLQLRGACPQQITSVHSG